MTMKPQRRGVTILEVLFAILVTSVGLLGAIAVIPVASMQARKGRIADTVAIVAASAEHRFSTEMMARPSRWVVFNYNGADGNASGTDLIGWNGQTAFCIDPRFTAQNFDFGAGVLMNSQANSSGSQPDPIFPCAFFPAVQPLTATSMSGNVVIASPRMRRVSLTNTPLGGNLMTQLQADFMFKISDELTYDRPAGRGSPAYQPVDNTNPANQIYSFLDGAASNNATPGKRLDDGHLSWLATLAPKTDFITGQSDPRYLMSLVIFYDRPADLQVAANKPATEWVVDLRRTDVHGGLAGGEVSLTSRQKTTDELQVSTGDWMLVSGWGGIPPSSVNPPVPAIFRWYRVVEAGEDAYLDPGGSGQYKRDITLSGPDIMLNPNWGDFEVTIMRGIVSVYERTIRLERARDGNGLP